MGKDLLKLYKEKVKPEWKTAFLSALIIGLLVHLYKFTNTLLNHDSLFSFYSDQNVLGSGRWFLSVACGISSYFDLPWVNGLLSLVYIALTAVVVTEVLKLKNPVVITISGGVLAAFPGTTETFYFGFTADGYMLAMLMSALAVCLFRIEEKRFSRAVLSGVLICLSCAIYQAYVSFSLVLLLCYVMLDMLENKRDARTYFLYLLKQVLIFACAMAAYYIIWKLCMKVQGVEANDYQGIKEISSLSGLSFSPSALITGIKNTLKTLVLFFVEWNFLEHGITLYAILNIAFLVMLLIGIVVAVFRSKLIPQMKTLLLFVLCLAAIAPCTCIWHFVSINNVGYRPMMLQCIALLYALCAVIYDRWFSPRWSNSVGILLVAVVFNFGIMANVGYFCLNQSYERSYATGAEMVSRIHLLDEIDQAEEIVVVGTRAEEVALGITGPSAHVHILTHLLETDLLFDQVHVEKFLKNIFGVDIPFVSKAELEEWTEKDRVKEMDIWPAKDSMCVMENTLVIKLAK